MLKHLLMTVVVLLSLTGCVTSEESLDDTTNSSSSTNISQSSSLSSSSDRSSSSATSVESSSSVSSISSSALSSSSSSSVADSSSSISSSTGTIVPSSSSSSSTSSTLAVSSLSSSSSSSTLSSSSLSSSTISSSSSSISSSSSSSSSISSSSSSSSITSSSSSSSSVANAYLERVDIPQYDPDNPTHVLITTGNGMWTSSVLNDPNYKHFYVEPGRYQDRYINLTASGSKNDRRTMSLYNGNDTHPAALPDNQVADVLFHFNGADYWTIDRMANLDRNINPSMRFINGATHNIINRWHLRNFKYGVSIYPYCHYNTVQNSYINHATESARSTIDAIALNIHTNRKKISKTIGVKFINNDIRNATDGIQITRSIDKFSHDVTFEGTVMDSNRIWIDSDIYANENTQLNRNGGYCYAENAIDLKAGSENPNNPVIITNNIMWGYNKVDLASSKAGKAFTSHNGVRHVKMNHNIIADSMTGLILNSAEDWEFKDNVLHNIYTIGSGFMLRMSTNKRVKVEDNIFVNDRPHSEGWSLYIHDLAVDDSFKNNIFINTSRAGGDTAGHTFDNNWFYHSRDDLPSVNTKKYGSATEAKMSDYTFTYERFTKTPKQKTLKGIITTKDSPHYKKAGSISSSSDVYVSPYLEPVHLPVCDASNPEVQFITTNSDWSHINDVDKSIFCVSPGDYSSIGNIQLQTGGTKNKKRYIILNNGNNTHPKELNLDQLAKVAFVLQDTKYWVIDRMAYWDSPTTLNHFNIVNSDYNIIDRYFMKNVGSGIYIYPNSDNNTIQNSYIQRTDIMIFHDRPAIGLLDNRQPNIAIKNTKILNNEIKNFVDGFQAIRTITKNINYEGTILDNNLIYIDSTIYTDCSGNHDKNGACAYAENAIDLKAGSLNQDNPIVITHNKLWGYKKSDTTNSELDDPGVAIVGHYNIQNIIIKNNTIFNSDYGININDPLPDSFSISNANIENNTFSNILNYPIGLVDASDINMTNNLIVNLKNTRERRYGIYWLLIIQSKNIIFEHNKIFNTQNNTPLIIDAQNLTTKKNEYYMSDRSSMSSLSDVVHSTNPLVNYQDLVVKLSSSDSIVVQKIVPF